MRLLVPLAIASAVLALGAAPAAAQRQSGLAELDAQAAFNLRGVEDADGVATVGDVDGDGRVDAAIWTEDDDDVRIVLAGDPVPGLRGFRIRGVRSFQSPPLSAAGDVTGDGLADMVAEVAYGVVAVVPGRRDPRDVDLRRPEQRAIALGGPDLTAGTAAGDVNGDGTADLLVAGDTGDEDGAGFAYVVFGGPQLRGRIDVRSLGARGFRIEAAGDDGPFVLPSEPVGDLDGDGLADIALGSPFAGVGDVRTERELLEVSGAAHVVYGRRETSTVDLGRSGARATRIEGRRSGYLGFTLAGAGDVNGDGLPDLAVAAPLRPGAEPGAEVARGEVFVVYGRRERRDVVDADAMGDAGFRIIGATARSATGFTLARAGDVDGDGLADLLVGAPGLSASSASAIAGAAHVVYGAREPAEVALTAPGERALTLRGGGADRAGSAIAAGTDLDGDGRAELLVSRPGACRVGRLDEGDVVAVEPASAGTERGPGAGTDGPDSLTGGPVGDTLLGYGEVDTIAGEDGHDCIGGGDGDDRLSGGRSGDAIFGELGADAVNGDVGCDRIFGGDGDDVITAGPARLSLQARLEAPIGARDRDQVSAGPGDDRVRGGADDDLLSGGEGADNLTSGPGDDAMEGNAGRDRLIGSGGSDYLVGGYGTDVIRGGAGRDFLGGDVDLGLDFDADVPFGLGARRRIAGDDDISGGSGNDQMHGEAGRDRIDGGSGNDSAQGMGGDDRLIGADGADNLQGGPGEDRITGGSDRDLLAGASGDDTILGGTFGDRIDGGSGRDRIDAGSGPDRIDVRDGSRDVVRCGPGRDSVSTDRRDVTRGCERINGRARG
jgi:Ca2+-binding RTX toxin-like protein